jgi:hypothetical protein
MMSPILSIVVEIGLLSTYISIISSYRTAASNVLLLERIQNDEKVPSNFAIVFVNIHIYS